MVPAPIIGRPGAPVITRLLEDEVALTDVTAAPPWVWKCSPCPGRCRVIYKPYFFVVPAGIETISMEALSIRLKLKFPGLLIFIA